VTAPPLLSPHAVAAAAAACCPGFTPAGDPIRTETSLLLPGTTGRQAVLAKAPTDRRPFWIARARHEITIYQALARTTAPVPTPVLLGADPAIPLLVISRLPGTPLSADRYPSAPVQTAAIAQLRDALDVLHAWSPPGTWPDDSDYPSQLAHLPSIAPDDLAMFTEVHAWTRTRLPLRLEHGDAHLANVLAFPGRPPALIDLEFLALRLPGYDSATLWILLGDQPRARAATTHPIGANPLDQAAFWLAATLCAARELASHRRWAPTSARQARIPRLTGDLDTAMGEVRALHATIPHHTTGPGR
jgi:aminoglycoside phosphotransferase (APT) family kinase protein